MIEPVYIDIHIHTSENPDVLSTNYDVDELFKQIRTCSQGCDSLISLTDHNTINEQAYMSALSICGADIHLLLGVELHIHYTKDTEAYHCHMIFKNEITSQNIKEINCILNDLYPHKVVEKSDESIPTLNDVINKFDNYEFVLLPHGGQSHSTFNKSIPEGARFDTMMERSVYYNQFDGFTARNATGREETDSYFKRLGISEFVNLITCSDNYCPAKYPQSKNSNAEPLIPTWMFAEPTFEGFRLSLSERSRLLYQKDRPKSWSLNIGRVACSNELLDIDVSFTSGLNVVIGGSSSGKTLLVESIYRKLSNQSFDGSPYFKFGVKDIEISNPSLMQPHYIHQNYIVQVVNNENNHGIEDIDIVKSLFPQDEEARARIEQCLLLFKNELSNLVHCVEKMQNLETELQKIAQVGSLLVFNNLKKNIFDCLLPVELERKSMAYLNNEYENHIKILNEIKQLIQKSPFVDDADDLIDNISETLNKLNTYSKVETSIYSIIKETQKLYEEELKKENSEDHSKISIFNQLIENVKKYVEESRHYKYSLRKLSSFSEKVDSHEVVSSGHHLFVSNRFEMNKDKLVEVFNSLLKNPIISYDQLIPNDLFDTNFKKKSPKVENYEDFIEKVCAKFRDANRLEYKITTAENKDYDTLSAGWKTSILLDLILGYDKDIAPIIIDQPEDNLATKYINDGLVSAIKKIKDKKQIIMVSHNATIPMMGDAQCVVFCENKGDKIVIRSSSLEGEINTIPALDLIASITDGGKSSIKKRVKKYNLKKYSE